MEQPTKFDSVINLKTARACMGGAGGGVKGGGGAVLRRSVPSTRAFIPSTHFGFNVGVEAGQLAIVVLALPLTFAVRGSWAYRRLILGAGSLAIVAVAVVWFVERAFDLPLLDVLPLR